MATRAGVWIDHKQAVVVLITDAGVELKKVAFAVEQPARPASSSRSKNKYTPNDFIAEDRRERKVASGRKQVYEKVLALVRGADALLVLGPGEAKGEFSKHITSKKLRGLKVELETTDKLSDRQLAAKVSEHFTGAPLREATAPRRTAKRKAAIAAAGKRTKKAGK